MLSFLYLAFFIIFHLIIVHQKFVMCIFILNGRYTKEIENFDLLIPHRSSIDGKFISYNIPSYFKHDSNRRRKRSLNDENLVHYGINVKGKKYLVQLWPNHDFISPNIVFENRNANQKVQNRKLRNIHDKQLCYYTGQIENDPNSHAALSTCDGLSGYITINKRRYFIEPLENHIPNKHGQHLHVIYERLANGEKNRNQCGTTSNWESAWKKRLYNQFRFQDAINMIKRGDTSLHRYLETLVVCDKKFLDYHKNTDYETYVLTIMNMVADYYHDSTSGNQMDVVVVRIMYLDKEEEEIDLAINPNADDTLASFCKWQEKINPKDKSNPNHHDIAVLLTRYDICADNMSNCGLMGLAYVASACTSNEPCCINEDGGLVLGIVVAHEMGHVMGCAHDKEGESTCPAQDKDESYFVMAPYVHLYTTRWSTCSKTFITSLFENNLGECLNDEPEISLYKYKNMLPGAIYDAKTQCNILFPNSSVCPSNSDAFCELLLCQTSPTACMGNEEPPADGTKCGENKWCYRKKCVEIGERPEAINGGWGNWGSYSQCSRTCGGGVSLSERNCDNPVPENKGRYCIGERKKVKTCNMQACPDGSASFRETQCEEHNNKEFRGSMYKWTAHFKIDEPCILYCISDQNSFAKLEPRVKDGTKCKPGTNDMCISGVCRKVGCDGNIDSDAVEDICGICNGDGTQCNIIENDYSAVGRGYTKVVTIPTGSRNILIEEHSPSDNMIAISDNSESKYYVNGDFTEGQDGVKKIGDVEGVYSHPEPNKEKLQIRGPLKEDVVFSVVFFEPKNVGYHYKYSEATSESSYEPQYHWEQLDWNECSAKCGGGAQTAKISCVEEKAGKVSDSFCESSEKPEITSRKCNEHSCPVKWRVGKWGICHACKFKSGVRSRDVECVKESPHTGAEDMLVEDKECSTHKPGTTELCNSHKKCKNKRSFHGLPEYSMRDVWKQIFSAIVQKYNVHKNKRNDPTCSGETKSTTVLPKLEIGKIVKDVIPGNEIKVVEVPLKLNNQYSNLSDNTFESIEDVNANSIDTSKAKVLVGQKAANALKKSKNGSKNKNS